MVLFLLTYLAVYGGIHLYFFLKARQAFRPQRISLVVVILFLILMVFAPILVRYLDRAGYHGMARPPAFFAYIWMAVVLWFFAIGVVADIWNAAIKTISIGVPTAGRFSVPPKGGMILILSIILVSGLWGLYEAGNIRMTAVKIKTDLLSPGSRPIRIVQISDLHLGLIVGEARLKKVAGRISVAEPDIIVSTGDLVDGTASNFDHLAGHLADIKPRLGKFAVLGNHEYYAGIGESLEFHKAAGFRMLRGETYQIDDHFIIAGVDDPAGRRIGQATRNNEDSILPPMEKKEYCILLKHRPDVKKESLGRFDLQLSGHTHKGQLYPFNYLVRLVHPRLSGFFKLGKNSSLYVSPGTGTWGPPMRLMASPEITLITVEPR